MVSEHWFDNEDRFDVLTELLRRSTYGGTIRARNVEAERALLEEGVEEGWVTRDELVACPSCDRNYSLDKLPVDCSCGTALSSEDREPDVVQYHSLSYPEILRSLLGTSIEEFQIKYQQVGVEEFPASELHTGEEEDRHIHISPHFKIESGIHTFPGFRDVLIGWDRVPQLITSPQDAVSDIEDFLDAEESAEEWADQQEDELLNNSPQPSPDDFTWDSSELTMLHHHDKDHCHEFAQEKYGYNYNSMFERFGAQFLHHFFPYIPTFFAAGENKPDGYIVQNNRTYLVEAKCWSSDFKITKERDKMVRYIDDFQTYIDNTPGCDFNLYGYIFIAHSFQDSTLEDDIEDVERRVEQTVNLETICISDKMMAEIAEQLTELYRMDPSAPYRIYEHSQWYSDILDDLTEYTQTHGTALDPLQKEILEIIQTAAETEATQELNMADGFGPRSRWDKLTP